MNSIEDHLEILDKKLLTTDYVFLDSTKQFFYSNNPYFLVCLAEIVHKYQEIMYNQKEEEITHHEISFEDYLKFLVDEATDLYFSSNISEALSPYISSDQSD